MLSFIKKLPLTVQILVGVAIVLIATETIKVSVDLNNNWQKIVQDGKLRGNAALDMLERYAEAADAFERAFELDVAGDLDRLELDDGYFSAALAAGRDEATRGDVSKAAARLDTYVSRFPLGNHVAEAKTWKARMRGEMPSLLDKTRDANDVDLP